MSDIEGLGWGDVVRFGELTSLTGKSSSFTPSAEDASSIAGRRNADPVFYAFQVYHASEEKQYPPF